MMGSRTTIVAGLAAGAVVAAAILVGAVVLLPDPGTTTAASAAPSTTPVPSSPAVSQPDASPSSQTPIGPAAFRVGEPAPALSVGQVGGGQINLANLSGRPVWIDFMQTTCPPCVDEFRIMSGFAARYASGGLVVIAVDVREDEGTVATFVKSLNAQFPVGLDADGAAARAWGAASLPTHFWMDSRGVIRAGALGGIGPDGMARNLGMILPGVQVTP